MSTNGTGAIAVADQSSQLVASKPATDLVARPAALLPTDQAWQQMGQMAVAAYKSGLMPDGVRNQEAALITALKGYELGVPFMAAIEGIHIIKGKATVGAHLMLALIKRTYGGQAIRVAKTDTQECTIQYREPGWDAINSYAFTWQDATKAGLTGGDNWKKYPAAMLRARAISAVGKMAFPEVVGGLYVAGELGDAVMVTEDGDVIPDLRATTATVVEQQAVPAPATTPRAEPAIQEAEIREVPPTPVGTGTVTTWAGLFEILREAKGLTSKSAVAKHLGRESVDGLSPQDIHDLVMGNSAPAESAQEPAESPVNQLRKPPAGIQMTAKQWWKLWASANEKLPGQADAGLHAIALETFERDSLKDLTVEEASKVIDYLEQNTTESILLYLGPVIRKQAIARGQQELPIAGSNDPSPEEAALINFRERAEADSNWDQMYDEAGTSHHHWAALVEASSTIGQLNGVVDRVKKKGLYNKVVITAEQKVRPRLQQRAAALTR